MAKGFTDDKGRFRPTGNNNHRKSSRKKSTETFFRGLDPLEPFTLRERLRLSNEEEVSRTFSRDEIDDLIADVDAELQSIYFQLNPERNFFSPTVAFEYAEEQGGMLDPEFDMLLTERRKLIGASNRKTMRSLGGASIFDPEPTGFPEVDEMRN